MSVLFHGTYGDHFSPLYVFFGVEQASKYSLHLRQESFPLIGMASGTYILQFYVHLHVDYTHEVVQAL